MYLDVCLQLHVCAGNTMTKNSGSRRLVLRGMAWAPVRGGFWSPFCDLYNAEVADWF